MTSRCIQQAKYEQTCNRCKAEARAGIDYPKGWHRLYQGGFPMQHPALRAALLMEDESKIMSDYDLCKDCVDQLCRFLLGGATLALQGRRIAPAPDQ